MRAHGRHHHHHLLLVALCGACVTGGGLISPSQLTVRMLYALDHTNTCAHVNLEVKIGQNEYIVSLSLADSRSLKKFWGI